MSRTPAEADWARRVRANRDQVDRLREVPDGSDFYAPVSGLFVEDPRRTGDPTLDALRARARPGDTWLDIGAGAGRYALPLALSVRRVIAVEPSAGMLTQLRAAADQHRIGNLEVVEGAWPLPSGSAPTADVALIAHVGYDVEAIGPFLDAMEAAARRRCVAVLMDRSPRSAADPFWFAVHGEERAALPGMAELIALLRGRGRRPRVERLPRAERRWPDQESLLCSLRHQLWVAEGSAGDRRLLDELSRRLRRDADGVWFSGGPREIAIVDWRPPGPSRPGRRTAGSGPAPG